MLGVHKIYKFRPSSGHEIVHHLGFNLQFPKRVAMNSLLPENVFGPHSGYLLSVGLEFYVASIVLQNIKGGTPLVPAVADEKSAVNLTIASLEYSVVFPWLFL